MSQSTPLSPLHSVREPFLADGAALVTPGYYGETIIVLSADEMDKLVEWWAEHRPQTEDEEES